MSVQTIHCIVSAWGLIYIQAVWGALLLILRIPTMHCITANFTCSDDALHRLYVGINLYTGDAARYFYVYGNLKINKYGKYYP